MYPGTKFQNITHQYYRLKHDLQPAQRSYFKYSSGKTHNFFNDQEFKEALCEAEKSNSLLLIHDIFSLLWLMKSDENEIENVLGVLFSDKVEIIDTLYGIPIRIPPETIFTPLNYRIKMEEGYRRWLGKQSHLTHENDTTKASSVAASWARYTRSILKPKIEAVIAELKKAKKPSIQTIADELNARGIRTQNGRVWSRGNLAHTLKKLEIDHMN